MTDTILCARVGPQPSRSEPEPPPLPPRRGDLRVPHSIAETSRTVGRPKITTRRVGGWARFSWPTAKPQHSWSLLECAALCRSSQRGTCGVSWSVSRTPLNKTTTPTPSRMDPAKWPKSLYHRGTLQTVNTSSAPQRLEHERCPSRLLNSTKPLWEPRERTSLGNNNFCWQPVMTKVVKSSRPLLSCASWSSRDCLKHR